MKFKRPKLLAVSGNADTGEVVAKYQMRIADDQRFGLSNTGITLFDDNSGSEVTKASTDTRGDVVFEVTYDTKKNVTERALLLSAEDHDGTYRLPFRLDLQDPAVREAIDSVRQGIAAFSGSKHLVPPIKLGRNDWYPDSTLGSDIMGKKELRGALMSMGHMPQEIFESAVDVHRALKMPELLANASGDLSLSRNYNNDFRIPAERDAIEKLQGEYRTARDGFLVTPSIELHDQRLLEHVGLKGFCELILGKMPFIQMSPELKAVVEKGNAYSLKSLPLSMITRVLDRVGHLDHQSVASEAERAFRESLVQDIGPATPDGELKLVVVPVARDVPGLGNTGDRAFQGGRSLFVDFPTYILHLMHALRRHSLGQELRSLHGGNAPVLINAFTDEGRIVQSRFVEGSKGAPGCVELSLSDPAEVLQIRKFAQHQIGIAQSEHRHQLETINQEASQRRIGLNQRSGALSGGFAVGLAATALINPAIGLVAGVATWIKLREEHSERLREIEEDRVRQITAATHKQIED